MGLRSCLTRLWHWFWSAPPAAAPRLRPLLEQLETREVPAVNANQAYLATLYQGFLERPIDAAGISYWSSVLASTGGNRTAVAADILKSQEYHGRELQLAYGALLARPIDPEGLRFWGNVLESGGTYEQVKAGILSSQELFTRLGGTFNNFLNAVFQSQLGSLPTAIDLATYATLYNQTGSRAAVVQQILNSATAHQVLLNGVYQEILSRPLDPLGATYWGNILRGGTIDTVLAGVVGSPEYFTQLTNFLNSGSEANVTDINQAANDFLTAGAKFSAQLPGLEQLDRFIATDNSIRTALTTASAALPSVVIPTAVSAAFGTTTGPTSTVSSSPSTPSLLTSTTVPLTAGSSSSITGTNENFLTTAGAGTVTGTGSSPFAGGTPSITGTTQNFFTSGGAGMVTGMGTTLDSGFGTFF